MIYLNKFDTHTSYDAEVNRGGKEFKIPNVSYCEDVKDVHYNPYNTVKFYVGEITGTTPQTVSIYTDKTNHIDFKVSEGNKWYSYLLPKGKGLYKIGGNSVKKVVVKADIKTTNNTIIPDSTVEASFKGSNTSNVISMSSMFEGCVDITSLDVSSFNTSNVTDMNSMFNDCSKLTSLDVSNFNTSNVTDMGYMFNDCNGLTSLTLSNFDTSKVTNMSNMFSYCGGITSLDLSGFKTSNVTVMGSMFDSCSSLTSLTLSNFDTSKVTNMSGMFSGCSALKEIKMIGCTQPTIDKIKAQLNTDGITGANITT